ncbi:MAG: hypothetical protein LC808_43785, partial [Actinobacteria bacterium]|nr:hypothetical protein [Actinomycetota bacterium]
KSCGTLPLVRTGAGAGAGEYPCTPRENKEPASRFHRHHGRDIRAEHAVEVTQNHSDNIRRRRSREHFGVNADWSGVRVLGSVVGCC